MNINSAKKCPVCDSINISNVLTAVDYLVSHESFNILECSDCTLRFTSPIPNKSDINKYYQSDNYISHTGVGNTVINKVYKFVKYFTLRSKKKKVQRFSGKKIGSILDIGCGTGEFLKTMKQANWEVSGIENNEFARNHADTNVGLTIMNQSDFFASAQNYDVITLWHSLEHLYDLKKYLNKISISLNFNGVVMIAVPNYQSYDAEYFMQDWAAYDVPRHLYHFSFDSIVNLLWQNNFQLIKSSQLPFDPYYISLLSELSVRRKQNIFKAILIGMSSYLAGRKDEKKGSSILYIFRKN